MYCQFISWPSLSLGSGSGLNHSGSTTLQERTINDMRTGQFSHKLFKNIRDFKKLSNRSFNLNVTRTVRTSLPPDVRTDLVSCGP